MQILTGVAVFIVTFVLMCIRGVLLWLVLVPSVLVWIMALLLWPLARPFGEGIPASPLFYSRWAAQFLDALLARITPLPRQEWPWAIDMRRSRRDSWLGAW